MCFLLYTHALKTGKPPFGTMAFFDYGIVSATLTELSLAEEVATSDNIVMQVILGLKPQSGVSCHDIAPPLTGVNSLTSLSTSEEGAM